MNHSDNLHLCLLELAEQLRHLLASPVVDNEEQRNRLWRLRDTALLALGETRAEMTRLTYQAIEPAASPGPPVWLPSPKMREQLQARRAARRPDPFAPGPHGPRL